MFYCVDRYSIHVVRYTLANPKADLLMEEPPCMMRSTMMVPLNSALDSYLPCLYSKVLYIVVTHVQPFGTGKGRNGQRGYA